MQTVFNVSETNRGYYETIYGSPSHIHHHSYIFDGVTRMLVKEGFPPSPEIRLLDLGCGNGSLSGSLADLGYRVTGIDSSQQGIETAKKHFRNAMFIHGDIASLPEEFKGGFEVVIAIEVIEHLYAPRVLVDVAKKALTANGRLLLTTPYHGYWKNLAVALMGRGDRHYNPLWDCGHVKFFSPKTLRLLLEEQGMQRVRFGFSGRAPGFWKSMICASALH